jgi:hypothetical protein
VLTRQGLQGGMGMSAEAAITNASATLVIKKIFFNMLKSPWGFISNSIAGRILPKIKREALQ